MHSTRDRTRVPSLGQSRNPEMSFLDRPVPNGRMIIAGGTPMESMDRRSVLGLSLAASALVLPTAAAAQTYGPTEGKEVGPGVRVVALGDRKSNIPAYVMVKLRDVVIQPGAKTPDNVMKND